MQPPEQCEDYCNRTHPWTGRTATFNDCGPCSALGLSADWTTKYKVSQDGLHAVRQRIQHTQGHVQLQGRGFSVPSLNMSVVYRFAYMSHNRYPCPVCGARSDATYQRCARTPTNHDH